MDSEDLNSRSPLLSPSLDGSRKSEEAPAAAECATQPVGNTGSDDGSSGSVEAPEELRAGSADLHEPEGHPSGQQGRQPPSRRRLPSAFCRLSAPGAAGSEAPDTEKVMRKSTQLWREGALFPVVPGRLYFAAHRDDDFTREQIEARKNLFFWSTDLHEQYQPFCADFGPVNLGMVARFCDMMKSKMEHPKLQKRNVVYYCSLEPDHIANTCFLLAAYLVIEKGYLPEEAAAPFTNWLNPPFDHFRDATFSPSSFDVSILDCCAGIYKAMKLGWFDIDTFDLDTYEILYGEDMDMSSINPKLWAFRGPTYEGGDHMPPEHFVPLFHELGITAVIRLNEADTYDAEVFEKAGIRHHNLYFDDCTIPSDDIITKFLDICDSEKGGVAVHCLAGLGRTGTLIALWMMKNYGLTAREAIAWLRVVRPGSVLGPQQHFLVSKDRKDWKHNVPPSTPEWNSAASAEDAMAMASQVKAAVINRGAR